MRPRPLPRSTPPELRQRPARERPRFARVPRSAEAPAARRSRPGAVLRPRRGGTPACRMSRMGTGPGDQRDSPGGIPRRTGETHSPRSPPRTAAAVPTRPRAPILNVGTRRPPGSAIVFGSVQGVAAAPSAHRAAAGSARRATPAAHPRTSAACGARAHRGHSRTPGTRAAAASARARAPRTGSCRNRRRPFDRDATRLPMPPVEYGPRHLLGALHQSGGGRIQVLVGQMARLRRRVRAAWHASSACRTRSAARRSARGPSAC